MKTYILNTLNRYKRFSESSDVKAILCNKSWRLFNDSGEQELYIFQDNGTMFYSVNGQVTNGIWQYISANQSLIITVQNQSYMLHPAFIDTVILALQLDGTQKYLFMIDEKNSYSYQLKTLNDIESYFLEKERKIEENQRLLQQEEEARHREEQRQAKARFRKEREEQEREAKKEQLRKEALAEWEKRKESIFSKEKGFLFRFYIVKILCWPLLFAVIVSEIMLICHIDSQNWIGMLGGIGGFILAAYALWIGGTYDIKSNMKDKFIDDYIKKHFNQQ